MGFGVPPWQDGCAARSASYPMPRSKELQLLPLSGASAPGHRMRDCHGMTVFISHLENAMLHWLVPLECLFIFLSLVAPQWWFLLTQKCGSTCKSTRRTPQARAHLVRVGKKEQPAPFDPSQEGSSPMSASRHLAGANVMVNGAAVMRRAIQDGGAVGCSLAIAINRPFSFYLESSIH